MPTRPSRTAKRAEQPQEPQERRTAPRQLCADGRGGKGARGPCQKWGFGRISGQLLLGLVRHKSGRPDTRFPAIRFCFRCRGTGCSNPLVYSNFQLPPTPVTMTRFYFLDCTIDLPNRMRCNDTQPNVTPCSARRCTHGRHFEGQTMADMF